MYRFVFVNYKDWLSTEEKHWMLLIETEKELLDFIEIRKRELSRSYFDAKKNTSRKIHHKSNEQALIEFFFIYKKHKDKETVLDDIMALTGSTSKFIRSYIESFAESRRLLVNSSNGYFPCSNKKDIKIYKIIESKEYAFPEDLEGIIRLSQWPGGTHWYATIGNKDVVVNGEQKWNTRKEALKMAKIFTKGDRNV